jgi:hypothetical protein
LEVRPDVPEDAIQNKGATLELDWYKQRAREGKDDPNKRWWTIVDMEEALGLPHATADRHVKNAYVKKWVVKKRGDKQGKGAPAEYRWNDSDTNPLWVKEQAEAELQGTF